jgi:hypothetical protein
MLKRWPAFTRFLDDDRDRLTNNAGERGPRGLALRGFERGGERAAAIYTLTGTADPQAPH